MTKDDKLYFEPTTVINTGQHSSGAIEKRQPVRFNNGIVYEGEWLGETR